MSMHSFKHLLQKQLARINFDGAIWAFPIIVGASWVLFPALDHEWKMSIGLASDPEATVNFVQELKDKRMAAFTNSKPKKIVVDDDEEEEEEEAGEPEDEEAGDEGGDDEEGSSGGDDDEEEEGVEVEEGEGEEEGEGGDDDEEEEEEDEDDGEPKKLNIPSLYDPVKGENVPVTDVWDNFTLKALNMSDDDDDEDEDDDDE